MYENALEPLAVRRPSRPDRGGIGGIVLAPAPVAVSRGVCRAGVAMNPVGRWGIPAGRLRPLVGGEYPRVSARALFERAARAGSSKGRNARAISAFWSTSAGLEQPMTTVETPARLRTYPMASAGARPCARPGPGSRRRRPSCR